MTIQDNPFLNLSIKRPTKVLKSGNHLDFDYEIEGLRGLLALAVMFVHGFGMQIIDTAYRVKGSLLWKWLRIFSKTSNLGDPDFFYSLSAGKNYST